MVTRAFLLAALAGSVIAATGNVGVADPSPAEAEPEQGRAGFICLWAIYATMAEVGRRCAGAGNAAADAELERAAARLEDYARRHSPAGAAVMARYRASQIEGHAGICGADALQMHEHIARAAPANLSREIDRLLASSPPVEWGTCF